MGTQIYEPVIFHQIDLLARTNVNKGRDEETALFWRQERGWLLLPGKVLRVQLQKLFAELAWDYFELSWLRLVFWNFLLHLLLHLNLDFLFGQRWVYCWTFPNADLGNGRTARVRAHVLNDGLWLHFLLWRRFKWVGHRRRGIFGFARTTYFRILFRFFLFLNSLWLRLWLFFFDFLSLRDFVIFIVFFLCDNLLLKNIAELRKSGNFLLLLFWRRSRRLLYR